MVMSLWYPEVSVALEVFPLGESGPDSDRCSWSLCSCERVSRWLGVTEMELCGLCEKGSIAEWLSMLAPGSGCRDSSLRSITYWLCDHGEGFFMSLSLICKEG